MNNKEYPIKETPATKLSEAEMDALYEEASLDLLRNSLKMSYKESFLLTTRLYKIQQTLKRAKITHQPFQQK